MKVTNLELLSVEFSEAVTLMEVRWALLRADRENARLLTRYIRSLRSCRRLRHELAVRLEKGTL